MAEVFPHYHRVFPIVGNIADKAYLSRHKLMFQPIRSNVLVHKEYRLIEKIVAMQCALIVDDEIGVRSASHHLHYQYWLIFLLIETHNSAIPHWLVDFA